MTTHHETPKKIERTAKSATLYRKVFGEILDPKNATSILDVGAGDSPFAEKAATIGQTVIRVDSDYARRPPSGEGWVAANATDLSAFEGQYDVSVSAFMMQHLSTDDQAAAIEGMIRATKKQPAEGSQLEGVAAIYPVYKPAKLKKAIRENRLDDFVFVHSTGLENTAEHVPISEDHLKGLVTLYVVNDARLGNEDIRFIAELIADSDALYRRTTARDIARRVFMRSGVTKVSR